MCHTTNCDKIGTDETVINAQIVMHCHTCRLAFVEGRRTEEKLNK